MTLSTSASSIIVAGNSSSTTFSFPFVANTAADITVSSIASNGATTILTPSQYTLLINPPGPNQLWGVGGTVTYLQSGSPIQTGTYLQISRTVPLTQQTSVQNQGNYFAQVTEQALDTLCMEIQQVAARTTQFRGTWATGIAYNFGDIVQDGANGNDTLNYYICVNGNTSGVWATDLAAGDWSISVLASVPTSNQPITLTGAVTGTGTTAITTTLAPLANNSITPAMQAQVAANTVVCNPSSASANQSTIALTSNTLLGRNGGNVAAITLGNTLSLQTNTLSVAAVNSYQNVIAAPSGTTNATGVMMGLAASITTATTGSIMIMASGETINTTSSGVLNRMQICYGTSTAPVNGAALTGTTAGARQAINIPQNGNPCAFGVQAIVTGLGIGSVYWVDLSLASGLAGNAATLANISFSIYEIK